MKNTTLAALVALLASVVLASSCAASKARADAVEVARAAVADGQVDDAEVVAIRAAIGDADAAGQAGGFDWTALGQIGLAVAGSLLGARALPNHLILGSKAAGKLA